MLPAGSRKAAYSPRAASLLLAAALAAPLQGCLSDLGPATCDRSEAGNPAVRYSEGTVEGGVYMSSPWDGELLYFPGGMRYEIEHHLGTTPRYFQTYLSFNLYGTKNVSEDPEDIERGTLAPASGNQTEMIDVNATTMTVVNGSCSEYWLLVVAGNAADPGGGGGG